MSALAQSEVLKSCDLEILSISTVIASSLTAAVSVVNHALTVIIVAKTKG